MPTSNLIFLPLKKPPASPTDIRLALSLRMAERNPTYPEAIPRHTPPLTSPKKRQLYPYLGLPQFSPNRPVCRSLPGHLCLIPLPLNFRCQRLCSPLGRGRPPSLQVSHPRHGNRQQVGVRRKVFPSLNSFWKTLRRPPERAKARNYLMAQDDFSSARPISQPLSLSSGSSARSFSKSWVSSMRRSRTMLA